MANAKPVSKKSLQPDNALVVESLDLRTQAADIAHAVEIQGLGLVVFGFFSAFEQSVIDIAEHSGEVLGKPVHHQFLAALYQVREARLNATAGQGRLAARLVVLRVLGGHWLSCVKPCDGAVFIGSKY